jgi:hypothetical protein
MNEDVENSAEKAYQLGYRQGKADGYELYQYVNKQLKQPDTSHYSTFLVFISGFMVGNVVVWLFRLLM